MSKPIFYWNMFVEFQFDLELLTACTAEAGAMSMLFASQQLYRVPVRKRQGFLRGMSTSLTRNLFFAAKSAPC